MRGNKHVMIAKMKQLLFALLLAGSLRAEPVPDKLVVLTFDDFVASQASYVAPLLKKRCGIWRNT
jgi:peptidoglycan/xylan/chitin deacetylase (PgdA/CDA1 family)